MDDRGRGAAPRFQHSELALALRAVRALDASPTSRGRVPAVLLFSAILLGLLHTSFVTRFPSYPVGATASAAFGAGNEDVSMQFKKMAAVVSSALAVSAGVHAQDAVQWRVADGGNGHWYQHVVMSTSIDWQTADTKAVERGGHLATISAAPENDFVLSASDAIEGWWVLAGFPNYCVGPWLGGYQPADAVEPAGGWRWVTSETFSFEHWWQPANEPNDGCGGEDYLCFLTQGGLTPSSWWNDGGGPECSPQPKSFVIEWSADCNSDGIVDYGQIRAGELEDANANNIPDCCEQGVSCDPCPGDVDESGTVNGVDLAAILAVWGSDGGKYPRADTNNDGVVNGADLATVLGSWGSCE